MKQNINLYLHLPKEFQNRIPFYKVLKVIYYLFAALFVVYLLLKIQMYIINYSFKNIVQEKKEVQNKLFALEKKYPKIAKNVVLQTQKDEAQEILGLHKELVVNLSKLSFSNDKGFSGYFLGLARQVVPNLWLREINIQKGSTSITLNGTTKEVAAVRKFLKKLSTDPDYQGFEFKIKRMETSTKISGSDDFSIIITKSAKTSDLENSGKRETDITT